MANTDISGQITDGSDNPIASAEVYLWREDLAGAGGVVASTVADSSGNFAFTAHPDGSGSSESWHVAAKDPNANVQLQSAYGVTASPPTSVNSQFNVPITGTDGPVTPGETLTVDASLSNSGTDSDTQTITLDIDNGVGQVDSSLEAAQAGASKTVPLSWSVPSGQTEQDYQATVSSADDSASQTVTVSSVPPSLVSHYTFDDADTNSGTAVDVVGSNDGTIQGATTGVSGANQTYTTNEAYSFDGTDDNVGIPNAVTDPIETANAFTLAAWVYNNDTGTDASVLSRWDGNGVSQFILYMDAGSSPTYRVGADDGGSTPGTFTSEDTNNATQNQWQHVVGTWDGSTASVYVDGALDNDTTDARTIQSSTNDAAVGAHNAGGGREFDGKIDDVRVYSKRLTSTEVSNLYNNGRI